MRFLLRFAFAVLLLLMVFQDVQAQRPASPRGEAATQIGDAWIVVDYGRPILRGRTQIFGSGESYGNSVRASAPVWRAGANKSTRLMTEVPLKFGDTEIPAGEYSLFVDLKPDAWTLIISSHGAKESGRDEGDGLWGSYNYTPDKDAARVPMVMSASILSVDQFSIGFYDVSERGGKLLMRWEHTVAMAEFSVGG
ncbi:MAG: DUF2911 domain-containing protein [Bacteroidota bacterium]|nr:DUF2911 domain-containing protein [Bacteroidota bacterium]